MYYEYIVIFLKRVNGPRLIFILVHFNNLIHHGLKKFKRCIALLLTHCNYVFTYSFQLLKSSNSEQILFLSKIFKNETLFFKCLNGLLQFTYSVWGNGINSAANLEMNLSFLDCMWIRGVYMWASDRRQEARRKSNERKET